MCVCVCVNGL